MDGLGRKPGLSPPPGKRPKAEGADCGPGPSEGAKEGPDAPHRPASSLLRRPIRRLKSPLISPAGPLAGHAAAPRPSARPPAQAPRGLLPQGRGRAKLCAGPPPDSCPGTCSGGLPARPPRGTRAGLPGTTNQPRAAPPPARAYRSLPPQPSPGIGAAMSTPPPGRARRAGSRSAKEALQRHQRESGAHRGGAETAPSERLRAPMARDPAPPPRRRRQGSLCGGSQGADPPPGGNSRPPPARTSLPRMSGPSRHSPHWALQ